MIESGLKKVIENSFVSVFRSVGTKIEVEKDYQRIVLDVSDKYANWAIENYGVFPLFGANRTAHVDELHIKLKSTDIIDRERFRNLEDIESEILNENGNNKEGVHVEEAIERAYMMVDVKSEKKDDAKKTESKIIKSVKIFMNLAILGVAGSGKTTSMKYIALQAARGVEFRGKKRLPFYISLRDLKVHKNCVRRAMNGFFKGFGFGLPEQLTEKFLATGASIILLDGIDELSEDAQRAVLNEVEEISRIPAKNSMEKTIIIISGRPYSLYRGLEGIVKYELLPFSDEDKYTFVKNWFSKIDDKRGRRLIGKLAANKDIRDIGANPLLLSLICALDYNEYDLPKRLDDLFEQCLAGLLGKWDSFRDVDRRTALGKLPMKKKINIVATLAKSTFLSGKIVFSEKDDCVQEACEFCQRYLGDENLHPAILLNSLYNDFGVLIERARGQYSFLHLRFQEYLTGYWLISARKDIYYLRSLSEVNMRQSYVIEYIVRNVGDSSLRHIITVMKKVNYGDYSQVKFLCEMLANKETVMKINERKRLLVKLSQFIGTYVKKMKKTRSLTTSYLLDDVLHLSIDVRNVCDEFRVYLRCVNEILKTINLVFNGRTELARKYAEEAGEENKYIVGKINVVGNGHDMNWMLN